jgi:hypothetical protein
MRYRSTIDNPDGECCGARPASMRFSFVPLLEVNLGAVVSLFLLKIAYPRLIGLLVRPTHIGVGKKPSISGCKAVMIDDTPMTPRRCPRTDSGAVY